MQYNWITGKICCMVSKAIYFPSQKNDTGSSVSMLEFQFVKEVRDFHPHLYMYICTGISLPNYTLHETARKVCLLKFTVLCCHRCLIEEKRKIFKVLFLRKTSLISFQLCKLVYMQIFLVYLTLHVNSTLSQTRQMLEVN